MMEKIRNEMEAGVIWIFAWGFKEFVLTCFGSMRAARKLSVLHVLESLHGDSLVEA